MRHHFLIFFFFSFFLRTVALNCLIINSLRFLQVLFSNSLIVQFYTNFLSFELFSHGLLSEEQNSSLRNKGRNQPPIHGSVICKVTKCLWVKCMLLIRSLKNWVSPASRFLEKSQSLTLQLSGWKQENSQSSCSQGSLGTGAISLPTQVWPPQL